MKFIIMLFFIVIITTGLFANPVFVLAGETCYVDEDAKDDGDGSDDEPYKKISKALDKDCEKIIVQKGTYEDDIVIGKEVAVEGENKDDVIITGMVTMKDDSELSDVTVSGVGVHIDDDANAEITDVKIKGASTGIETSGGGTLTVKDVAIYNNKKGMYIRSGKDVKITNSDVYDNDEEGIDIRSNVDGVISGNSIHNNGESGIEVILGKSDLTISDNIIKKNNASGIATQYYKDTNKLGGVKIKNNTITRNKDFGINCKVPSGGNPGVEYWTKSIQMIANRVYDNKDGEFSNTCHFDDKKVSDATKTKEQQEQERKALEEAQRQVQIEQEKKVQIAKEEQERKEAQEVQEEQKKKEQEKLREKLQYEKDLQSNVETFGKEIGVLHDDDIMSQEEIKSRSKILIFLIGPDYVKLQKIAQHISQYDEKIKQSNNTKNMITDTAISKLVQENIDTMMEKRNNVHSFVKQYNDTYSIFGWILKKKH